MNAMINSTILRRTILSAIVIIGACATSAIIVTSAHAHPGNTAADGAHYCWTNCEYWGETYGERHFHSGGGAVYEEEEYVPDEPDPGSVDRELEALHEYERENPSSSPSPTTKQVNLNTSNASESSGDDGTSDFAWWILGGIAGITVISYAIDQFKK